MTVEEAEEVRCLVELLCVFGDFSVVLICYTVASPEESSRSQFR